MIYKKFKDKQLSSLGMGAMRLPVIDGDDSKIDIDETKRMVDYAVEHGVNYFDTAWGYHNGMSEPVMGEVLAAYPRESFYLATKFPGYDLSNMPKVREIFAQQLQRCRVDYFDFYLMHNVCEMNIDAYFDDEKYGVYSYLIGQKEQGRIKHLGFSAHGSYETMKRFLEKYGENMEFCQIQLNYFDWIFQDARAKVELLNEYNIPVWVMEPVRGGKLAALSQENSARLKALRPQDTDVSWAFAFLQGIESVVVTLSGMSNMQQLKENIDTFSIDKSLNDEELSVLMSVTDDMIKSVALPCTACRYCTSHCPMGLDIPALIALYNEHLSTRGAMSFIAPMMVSTMPENKHPSACIGCRSCEAVCPQQIKISEAFADFANILS